MKKLFIISIAIVVCFFACNNKKTENQPVTTVDNLKTAITGETNASAKYALLSEEALNQGFNGIAAMFAAASAAEAIHVKSHTQVLNDLGETIEVIAEPQISENMEENILGAIEGETYEFTEMYPPMVTLANNDGNTAALISFTYAQKAEEVHAKLYSEALELLKAGKAGEIAKIWYVCPLCGNLFNTLDGNETCAICGVGKEAYTPFEK